jgi:hypothetical protein
VHGIFRSERKTGETGLSNPFRSEKTGVSAKISIAEIRIIVFDVSVADARILAIRDSDRQVERKS